MPYAPFLHNVDAPDHGRALRVTETTVAGEVRIAAGRFRIDQTVTNRPAATLFPPAPPLGNGVNWIYINSAGAIATTVGGPFPANSIPLAQVTIAAGVIVPPIVDCRCFFYEDTAAGGGGGYDTIEDEGGALPQRTVIDFQGAGVTAADVGGETRVTIPGGGAPHNILDGATHPDSVVDAVSAGSIIIGNDTPKWDELVITIPGAASLRNVLGVDTGETLPSYKVTLDAVAPATITPGGAGAAGASLLYSHRDHDHPAPATYPATAHNLLSVAHGDVAAAAAVLGDVIVALAGPTWTRYAIAVPGANLRNVLGVDAGDTVPTYKALLSAAAPADIAAAASAGTSLTASHVDHVHAHPVFGATDLHPEYMTPAEHTAIADAAPHHPAVTLDANVATVFDIVAQLLSFDVQAFGTVFAGPIAGVPAVPAFRGLNVADIPAHALLSATHSATTPAAPVVGDLITGQAGPVWARFGIGGAGNVLTVVGGLVAWAAPAGGGHVIQEGGVPVAAEPALNFLGGFDVTDVGGVSSDVSLDITEAPLSGLATTVLGNLGVTVINASLIPAADSAIDLGSNVPKYFANAYVDTVYLNATATLDGATAGLVNVTGNVQVSGTMGVAGTAPTALIGIKLSPAATGTYVGINDTPNTTFSGDSQNIAGVSGGASGQTDAARVGLICYGLNFFAAAATSGAFASTFATLAGIQVWNTIYAYTTSTNTVTNMYGINVIRPVVNHYGSGVAAIGTYYGIFVGDPATATHITTSYGINIAGPTLATTNYGLYITGATAAAGTVTNVLQPFTLIGAAAAPALSAVLELQTTTGALLVSRLTTAQLAALTPVNGMIAYESTLNLFKVYENGAWRTM